MNLRGLVGREKDEKRCFVDSGRSDLGGEKDCFRENYLEVEARERYSNFQFYT